MAIKPSPALLCCLTVTALFLAAADGFMPLPRSLWDSMVPSDDPFRILEQMALPAPRDAEALALTRVDWKETPSAHVISMDVPGMKKEDVKVEVEENRVLRVTGERRAEEQAEGDKWHRAERINGKFWRQFRMPGNADLERVEARLEDGVLRITVPKLAEERRRQPRIISVADEKASGDEGGRDVKVGKDELKK